MNIAYPPTHMLDTNICIYLMKHSPPEIFQKFSTFYYGELVMSAITLAELEFGVVCKSAVSESDKTAAKTALKELCKHIVVCNFDAKAAHSYGLLRFAHKDKKRDALDKLIASHALALGVTLVTNNLDDFKMFAKLKLENWVDR